MVSEYIRISGDGCFLISSSCDKTFLNPSDISFIHCFLELFRTLISNTFSTIQFLYFSFASFFTPFDNWSIYKVFSFGYKISGPDISVLFPFLRKLVLILVHRRESWRRDRVRLSECVTQQNNYCHCYIGPSHVVIISLHPETTRYTTAMSFFLQKAQFWLKIVV